MQPRDSSEYLQEIKHNSRCILVRMCFQMFNQLLVIQQPFYEIGRNVRILLKS